MEAVFYLKDVEQIRLPKDGKPGATWSDSELFFKFAKESIACANAQPFEYDGKATEDHKKNYPKEYAAFLESQNPVEDKKSKKKLVEAEVAAENLEASEVDV